MREVDEHYINEFMTEEKRILTKLPYSFLIGGLICLNLLSRLPKIEKIFGFVFRRIRKRIK